MKSQTNKVLVIDDSPEIQESLKLFIEELGCEVYTTANGEEGMALARTNAFKLILLDICMPVMDGKEVLEKMKEIFPDTPIIMITGHKNEDTAKKCMEMGAYDFISKPFDFDYLQTSVLSTLLCS